MVRAALPPASASSNEARPKPAAARIGRRGGNATDYYSLQAPPLLLSLPLLRRAARSK